MKAYEDIIHLLRDVMGLKASSIGIMSLERAIQQGIADSGSTNAQNYFTKLQNSDSELQALIEQIVVPETWFFRYPEAFKALSRFAFNRLQSSGAGVFKVLSIPCSTGEEPYSIAMALLDAGLMPQQMQVDAVDISEQALQSAKVGVYTKNSFRGDRFEFRDRYFQKFGDGYLLNNAVKQQVNFRQGNLLRAANLFKPQTYDAVFCRNVLIYFDVHHQKIAISQLAALLKNDGMLFVGASEPNLLRGQFHTEKIPHAFALRHFQESSAKVKSPEFVSFPRTSTSPDVRALMQKPITTPFSTPAFSAASPLVNRETVVVVSKQEKLPRAGFDEVLTLADQGQLEAAKLLCEKLLQTHSPSAQGYYVAGLLEDASRNPGKADDFYRKSLYLDPEHHDALLQLAYLQESRGKNQDAQRLKERAKRVLARKPGE